MNPVLIDGVPREYAWGSRTAIQKLLEREPDGRPLAELWFGAHPDGPSPAPALDTTLDALIAADPEGTLGGAVLDTFGARLPFLLKILAADTALSIQVHPNLDQARAGYAREDAAGVPRDAPNRNYRDANHKPELLCALTAFEALCGFRPVAETLGLLRELDLPQLRFLVDALRGPDPLRTAFRAVLTEPAAADALPAVVERARPDGPLRGVHLAATDFPGDAGALVALLLNHVRLEPGQAVFLGAGNVHAYLRGVGVEVMAESDNVLRCGLTHKHVDVPELLRIAEFTETDEPRWPQLRGRYRAPVPDFELTRLHIAEPTGLHDPGPTIVLCTAGEIRVADLELRPAHAVFVPAGIAVTLAGSGDAFVAAVAG
jgi:mannose-6-phosphate isomerase